MENLFMRPLDNYIQISVTGYEKADWSVINPLWQRQWEEKEGGKKKKTWGACISWDKYH